MRPVWTQSGGGNNLKSVKKKVDVVWAKMYLFYHHFIFGRPKSEGAVLYNSEEINPPRPSSKFGWVNPSKIVFLQLVYTEAL